MLFSLALAAALYASPNTPPLRWLLLIGDVPVAEVSLTVSVGEVTYDSVAFFERKKRRFSARFAVDAKGLDAQGRASEVWWLSRRRPVGCQRVFDENDGGDEAVCFTSATTGTIEKKSNQTVSAFEAQYRKDGMLERLTAAGFSVVASQKPLGRFQQVFEPGFKVISGTGPLRLSSGVDVLRRVFPRGVGTPALIEMAQCLDAAKAYQAEQPRAIVRVGVVVEGALATPHAWIELDGEALEPSVEPGSPVLQTREYHQLPRERAGLIYLGLRDQSLRLTRRPR
jgi:hypothetical protein